MEDKRDILKNEQPFSWKILKEDKAFIYWNNRNIKTVSGKDFVKLASLIAREDPYQLQLFCAKITGHFKH